LSYPLSRRAKALDQENGFNFLLKDSVRSVRRQFVERCIRDVYFDMPGCYVNNEILSQQGILPWTQTVNDNIGQFSILWMYSYHHQCAPGRRGCIFHNTFIVK